MSCEREGECYVTGRGMSCEREGNFLWQGGEMSCDMEGRKNIRKEKGREKRWKELYVVMLICLICKSLLFLTLWANLLKSFPTWWVCNILEGWYNLWTSDSTTCVTKSVFTFIRYRISFVSSKFCLLFFQVRGTVKKRKGFINSEVKCSPGDEGF